MKISSQIGDEETMLFALELLDILQRAHIPFDPDGMGRTSSSSPVETLKITLSGAGGANGKLLIEWERM